MPIQVSDTLSTSERLPTTLGIPQFLSRKIPDCANLGISLITSAVPAIVHSTVDGQGKPQETKTVLRLLEGMNNRWFSFNFDAPVLQQRIEVERMANLLNCLITMGGTSLTKRYLPVLKRIAATIYTEISSYPIGSDGLVEAKKEMRLGAPAFLNNLAQIYGIHGDISSMCNLLDTSIELSIKLTSRQFLADGAYYALAGIPEGSVTLDNISILQARSREFGDYAIGLKVVYTDNGKINLGAAGLWGAEKQYPYVDNAKLFSDNREKFIRSERTIYQAQLVSLRYDLQEILLNPECIRQDNGRLQKCTEVLEELREKYSLSFLQDEGSAGSPNYQGTFEARSGELIVKMELLLSRIAHLNPNLPKACPGLTKYATTDFWTIGENSTYEQGKTVLYNKGLQGLDMMGIYTSVLQILIDLNLTNSQQRENRALVHTREELFYRIARKMVTDLLDKEGAEKSIERYVSARWGDPDMEALKGSVMAMGIPNDMFAMRDIFLGALNRQKGKFSQELLSGFFGSRKWGVYIIGSAISIPVIFSEEDLNIDHRDLFHQVKLSGVTFFIEKLSVDTGVPEEIQSILDDKAIVACMMSLIETDIVNAMVIVRETEKQILQTSVDAMAREIDGLKLEITRLYGLLRDYNRKCKDFLQQVIRFAPNPEFINPENTPKDRIGFLQLLGRFTDWLAQSTIR